VFSKAGFGTVITGSVLSGSVQAGDVVEILPEKIQARVRGVQSHDHTVGEVKAGYRAALNLAGVDNEQLYRGQVIGYFYRKVKRCHPVNPVTFNSAWKK